MKECSKSERYYYYYYYYAIYNALTSGQKYCKVTKLNGSSVALDKKAEALATYAKELQPLTKVA